MRGQYSWILIKSWYNPDIILIWALINQFTEWLRFIFLMAWHCKPNFRQNRSQGPISYLFLTRESTLVAAGYVSAKFLQIQRSDWREGLESLSQHWACLLSPVGFGICNPPIVDRQRSQRRDCHIRYEFNALHLAEFFPVDSWTVFGICVAVKKFGNDDHHNGWTAPWLWI